MGNWPIVTTQKSLPGETGGTRASLDIPDAKIEAWRKVIEAGKEITNIFERRYVAEGNDQYMNAQIKLADAELEFDKELREEQDQSKYQAMGKRWRDKTSSNLRPKHPLAAKIWDRTFKAKTPEYIKSLDEAMDERLKDKWATKYGALKASTIEGETGLGQFKFQLNAGVAAGHVKESWAEEEFRKVAHGSQQRLAENQALIDPEGFLKRTKGNKIEGFSLLTPGDIQDLRSTAKGEISFRKSREDAALSSFYTDITEKMQKGTSLVVIRELIQNQPGLTVDERDKAMKIAGGAYSTWDVGGTKENPWKSTQDYNALMEMQIKISRGETVTEMDVWRAQAAQPEKGPLFSRADGLNLISQLPDRIDSSLKTPVAKQWMADVDDMFMEDDTRIVKPENREVWMKTRQGAENIIRINHPDVGKTQKEIDAFLKPLKKEKTKGLMSRLLTFGSPLGIAEEITGLGRFSSPAKMAKALITTSPVYVETLEEAEKLKQGQKFEYQGKVYTRK